LEVNPKATPFARHSHRRRIELTVGQLACPRIIALQRFTKSGLAKLEGNLAQKLLFLVKTKISRKKTVVRAMNM
jgi:hypothetical protein